MEPAPTSPANLPEKALNQPEGPKPVRIRRTHRATRPQLLTRGQLDGRTNAAKMFDRMASSIERDLGGRERLSTIQLALIEAFTGAAVTLHHLNTQLALGQDIDMSAHATAVSAMVRVAGRLGLERVAKEIEPSLGEMLRPRKGQHERGRLP